MRQRREGGALLSRCGCEHWGSVSGKLEIRPTWWAKKLDYLLFIVTHAWLRAVLGDLISWHPPSVLHLAERKPRGSVLQKNTAGVHSIRASEQDMVMSAGACLIIKTITTGNHLAPECGSQNWRIWYIYLLKCPWRCAITDHITFYLEGAGNADSRCPSTQEDAYSEALLMLIPSSRFMSSGLFANRAH